jgi:hypothetical protein
MMGCKDPVTKTGRKAYWNGRSHWRATAKPAPALLVGFCFFLFLQVMDAQEQLL